MSVAIDFITSPMASNFVQNSACQVLSEGSLKAIGRPLFTLMDKTADKDEREYSATKEFVYQSLSMLSYFFMIFPVKKNTHRLLKYFPQLKNYGKQKDLNPVLCEQINNVLNSKNNAEYKKALAKITDKAFLNKVGGAQELMSIIASGLILTLVTPQVANRLVHPIMDKLKSKKTLKEQNVNALDEKA